MKKLKSILSKILEIQEQEINDNTSPQNVASWDSYNSLLIISEIEEEFKVKFSLEEVLKIKGVKDIKALLNKKGIKIL